MDRVRVRVRVRVMDRVRVRVRVRVMVRIRSSTTGRVHMEDWSYARKPTWAVVTRRCPVRSACVQRKWCSSSSSGEG